MHLHFPQIISLSTTYFGNLKLLCRLAVVAYFGNSRSVGGDEVSVEDLGEME